MLFDYRPIPTIDLEQVTTENGRYYINPATGSSYDSVTTILKRHYDQSYLEEWKESVGKEKAEEISEFARNNGTSVHEIMEDFIFGRENKTKLSPFQKLPIKRTKEFLTEHLGIVYGAEVRVFSDKMKAAGTFDLFGTIDGINTVIDYKTSKKNKSRAEIPHYFTQASIYAKMIEELYNIEVPNVLIIMINHGEKPDFYSASVSDSNKEIKRIFG